MGITFGNLKRNTRTIPVEYAGETFKISYKPGNITPALGVTLGQLSNDKSVLVEFALTVLISWDIEDDSKLVDENGHYPVLPLDEATLMDTPTPVLQAIQDAIQRDITTDSKKR